VKLTRGRSNEHSNMGYMADRYAICFPGVGGLLGHRARLMVGVFLDIPNRNCLGFWFGILLAWGAVMKASIRMTCLIVGLYSTFAGFLPLYVDEVPWNSVFLIPMGLAFLWASIIN
jgi:hypothetical protein